MPVLMEALEKPPMHAHMPSTAERSLTVVQMLPALETGGVERGTVDLAGYLAAQGHRSIVVSAGGRLREQLVNDGSEHVQWDVGAKRPGTLLWIRQIGRAHV